MLSQYNRQNAYRSICHGLMCLIQNLPWPLALHHRLIKSLPPITASLKPPQDTQLFLEVLKAFNFHKTVLQPSISRTEKTLLHTAGLSHNVGMKNRPGKQQEKTVIVFFASFQFFWHRNRFSSPWWIRASAWQGQLFVRPALTQGFLEPWKNNAHKNTQHALNII